MQCYKNKWWLIGLALSFVWILLFPYPVVAGYPERDLRYILHVQPGGATDILARKLAAGLQDRLGVNVIVENRPGGKSARQMAVLTKSDPDGYTIGAVTASHISDFNQSSGRYGVDSIEWLAGLVLDPYLIAIDGESPVQSLKELVAFAKQNPGELKVAGFSRGSGGHVAWEIFSQSAGLESGDVRWVPYDSVSSAVTAVLGGHVDVTIAHVNLVRSHVLLKDIRVLGIMADERAELLPDVPTFAEAGFNIDTSWQQFRGVIAPKGTPLEVQQKLAAEIRLVMATPEFSRFLESAQLNYGFMTPGEFARFARKQDQATKFWLEHLGILK
ncbi:tripartite tricarboxylate transporter substrate binding protein [Marinobacterium aestuariivivens]|uniref:Tripartite tricarboxylate transporter substrate binding protein n=1 Tax=Marinobacterium aestuariivivens TaxID=1698799 RepID=A0ABW2A9F2_9GAMM